MYWSLAAASKQLKIWAGSDNWRRWRGWKGSGRRGVFWTWGAWQVSRWMTGSWGVEKGGATSILEDSWGSKGPWKKKRIRQPHLEGWWGLGCERDREGGVWHFLFCSFVMHSGWRGVLSCLYGAGEGQRNNSAGRGIESLAYDTETRTREDRRGRRKAVEKERKGHYLCYLHTLSQVHKAFILD